MEEKKDHKIYMYTNKINGKVYIGRTCRTLEIRSGKNGLNYIGCPHFFSAIQKYGWKNFEPTILEENLSAKEAEIREIEYIDYYNSINEGYNIERIHGENLFSDIYRLDMSNKLKEVWANEEFRERRKSCSGEYNSFYGKHHTEESKEKMRKAKLGKKLTEEHKRKISKNSARPFKGKHHSEEAKRKISQAKIGRKLTEDHKKKVAQASKGRRHTNESKNKIRETHLKNGTYNAKKVLCVETGTIYKSLSEAGRSNGISRDLVRFACKDSSRTSGGFHWKFIN